MSSKKTRDSGMELLRIYAILSVIVLHYFNAGIGGGTNYVRGTLGVFFSRSFLTFAFCAVDLFVMISGYYLSASSKRSLSKIFFLLFEAAVFRVILYIINTKMNSGSITISGILSSALIQGYFIVFYSIIYLISPLINIGFDRMDRKNSGKAVVILFVCFSIIPSLAAILQSYHVFGSDWSGISTVTNKGSFEGYSIVNFFLCYVLGWYIRHWHNEKKKWSKKLLLLALNTLALLVWGYINWESAYTYDNPFVILEAAFLILIFKDFTFSSRFINQIATSGFTCYLIHGFFLRYIQIEKYVSKGWYVMIVHVIVSSAGIYMICYVIHKIYSFLTNWFVKFMSPKIDRINLTVCAKEASEKTD